MKKPLLFIMFLAIMLGISTTAFAQSVADYKMTTSTTGSLEDMSTLTTAILGPGTYYDSGATAVTNIGFTFSFAGTAYTQFSANSNGLMRLGSTVISGYSTSPVASAAILGPLSGDNSIQSTGKIHYKVVGEEPNRRLVVEWLNLRVNYGSSSTGTFCTMQAWLYESTARIDFVYGTMWNMSTSTQSRAVFISTGTTVGAVGCVATITTSPSWVTTSSTLTNTTFAASSAMTNLDSSADGFRRVFTFVPGVINPTSFTAAAAGSSQIDLAWALNASSDPVLVAYNTTSTFGIPLDGTAYDPVTNNAIPGGGTVIYYAGGTSYSHTSLAQSTTYYYKAWSVGTGSNYSSGVTATATTLTPPQPVPVDEGFESIETAGSFPAGWTRAGTRWTSQIAPQSTYNRAARTGTDYLTCQYSATTTDWMFSRGITMEASKTYDFGIWYNTDGLSGWTSFTMYVGTSAAGTAMGTTLATIAGPTNMTYAQLSRIAWQPPADGVYYVGLQVLATSSPWYMSFDDFSVIETPSEPVFSINPTTKAFGTIFLGENASQTFTVTNTGGPGLGITDISFTSGDTEHFSIANSTYTAPLGTAESFTFDVVFTPQSEGDFTATLTVTDDQGKAPHEVVVTGSGYDATIYLADLPYSEYFDGVTAPALPLGWTKVVSANTTYAVVQTYTSSTPYSAPNHAYMYNSSDTAANLVLITPPIDPSLSLLRLKFRAKSGTTGQTLLIGTMDEMGAKATFTQYGDPIALTTTYTEYVVDFDLYGASDRYIAFKHGLGSTYRSLYIDNVLIMLIPTEPVYSITPTSKDFGTITIGTQASQIFTITNIGVGSLGIVSVGFSGADAANFSKTDTNAYTKYLGESESMSFTVHFTPNAQRSFSAYLDVVDDLTKQSYQYPLIGLGTDVPNHGGGDPDSPAGGYYFANNISVTAPSKPNYYWWNVTTNELPGTVTSGSLDDGYWGPIPIGFGFDFYGTTYNDLYISTNGKITFGGGATAYSNTAIPGTGTPNNAIYLFWDDLEYYPGSSHVYYGVNGNGDFVITYEDMGRTGTAYDPNLSVTAQLILLTDGRIKMQYQEITGTTHTPTIGIENSGGTKGIQYFYTTTSGSYMYAPYHLIDQTGGIAIMYGPDENGLPVELSSFTAVLTAENLVKLTWVTQSETGVQGYYIYRNSTDQMENAILVSPLIEAANSSEQHSYQFIDSELYEEGTYYYWLQNVDFGGAVEIHGPVLVNFTATGGEITPELPAVTELKSIYPNPFSSSAVIPFSLAKTAEVSLKIYNTRGQLLRHFSLASKAPGNYQLAWDGKDINGKDCGSGVYYFVMQAGKETFQRKAILQK